MLNQKKVLALDDQRSMQNILRYALKKEFNVTVVGNADEAVRKAREGNFDFILIDINLDDDTTDGIDVAIRIEESGINAPIAFLSSMMEESLTDEQKEKVQRLHNLKFYQTKPISPLELSARIREVTG